MNATRPKVLVPVCALILTICAIAAVWTVMERGTASRKAQLQTSALTLALSQLQSAPFNADRHAGGDPPLILAKIKSEEALISSGLEPRAQTMVPRTLLALGRVELGEIEPVIRTIFRLAAGAGLSAIGVTHPQLIPTLQGRLTRRSADLSRILGAIGRSDDRAAVNADNEARFGTATALVALMIAFSYFYARSAAARDAARRAAHASALARDDAVESSNAKSMFVATVSHELRTPLAGVIGMTELLLDTELDGRQQEYANIAHSSAEGLLLVIGDILDYSKMAAGKIELEEESFSPRETIGEACAMMLIAAKDKGIELAVETDSSVPPWLCGDSARLRQVVINLVSNAVKFTDSGTIKIRTAATALVGFSRLRVEVTDSGIGIDSQTLARLFQPFTQADNTIARKYGGTGLGLTISSQLVELMGGTIGASSVPGTGSTFWFELTMALAGPGDQPRSHVPARNPALAAAPVASDAATILVAEDNPVNQILAARMLEKLGYETELVGDGGAALAAVQRTSYAAVLMDCQMPGTDGYQATREIRHREAVAEHLPIIAMTAHSMPGDREKCLDAGMDDYISKPMRLDLLGEVIARNISPTAELVAEAATSE